MSFELALVLALSLFAPTRAANNSPKPPEPTTLAAAVDIYRWFHAHPELSGQEVQTARKLAAELRGIGLEVHEGIGGHGLVAVLASGRDGPVILYRADMDALPVDEKTGLDYASQTNGVMHACGHDVHMATAVGALKVLATMRDAWRGTVMFVGQPAEEQGLGSHAMLKDPRFTELLRRIGRPMLAVALHDTADLPAGKVSLHEGYVNANVDTVDVIIHGKGGHGARPHETVDPIVIGSEIVMALQTIVSRRLGPEERGVITVGKFEAGTTHNVIPPRAALFLTVRSYGDATRSMLLGEIRHLATEIAKAHRVPRAPTITVKEPFTPAAFNDPTWTNRLREVFVRELGAGNVEEHFPSMGGEDFGRFSTELKIPGVMWRLGAVSPSRYARSQGKDLPGLHSDGWAPDAEPTIRTGIRTVVAAILDVLAPSGS